MRYLHHVVILKYSELGPCSAKVYLPSLDEVESTRILTNVLEEVWGYQFQALQCLKFHEIQWL